MQFSSKSVIACGFTPCIQRILEFECVHKGDVNRAQRVTVGMGGKGTNVARIIGQLGTAVELVGFAGGHNGKRFAELAQREGILFRQVETVGETRICQTLVEAGHPEATELVEEMPSLVDGEWRRMEELLTSLDLSGITTVSGKLPAGAPVNAYAWVAEQVARQGGRMILDAPGEPMLLALEHQLFMIKINEAELQQSDGGEDLVVACRGLIDRGAQSILITRGSRSAFFVTKSECVELFPPPITAVNPIGCGDAVTAGIAVELNQGGSLFDAVVTGIACGAASALQLVNGFLVPSDAERVRSAVRSEVH